MFNITTALCQTPAGFLADRIGPRTVLVSGLVLGSLCLTIVGLVPSFWLLVGMFAIFGIANSVYHPANYAMLSQLVSPERAATAFSMHIFAGFLGTAVTPATLLIAQQWFGWQGALLAMAVLALVVALAFLLQPAALFEAPPRSPARRRKATRRAAGGPDVRADPAEPVVLHHDHVRDHGRAELLRGGARGCVRRRSAPPIRR